MAGGEMGRVLDGLHDLGVRIAVDDFGTGTSAFSRLLGGQVDTLKIDKSFLQASSAGCDAAPLVSALVSVGHSLDLTVVAEGVEPRHITPSSGRPVSTSLKASTTDDPSTPTASSASLATAPSRAIPRARAPDEQPARRWSRPPDPRFRMSSQALRNHRALVEPSGSSLWPSADRRGRSADRGREARQGRVPGAPAWRRPRARDRLRRARRRA